MTETEMASAGKGAAPPRGADSPVPPVRAGRRAQEDGGRQGAWTQAWAGAWAHCAPLRRRLSGRTGDVLLAAGLTVLAVLLRLEHPLPAGVGASVLVVGLLVGASVPLAWGRTRPGPVLAVSVACYLLGELLDPLGDNAQSPLLACYLVARRTPAPRSLLAPAAMTVAFLAPERVGDRLHLLPSPTPEVPLAFADMVVAAGISTAVWLLGASRRRLYADAERLRDLAARLRAEQQVSARRAVTAERTRIARELHDLVAHHISAIALQARAVGVVLPDDPHAAGQGVTAIGEAADIALEEMRGLVCLLADPPPPAYGAAPGAGADAHGELSPELGGGPLPEPSLRHLDRLAAESTAVGCPVDLTVTGAVASLAPAVQMSAYRVVQEALSNVRKHAGAVRVRVEVTWRDGLLTVTVANAAPTAADPPPPLPGSGLGLIGMRERTALFRGTLRAGPDEGGGWCVVATFRAAAPDAARERTGTGAG
ncbi:sensor histidine kinase [Streptomyces alboflavus]|uniref:sensor histidine kinase n=1 Tax=Streptomyces alboflavus TaxID=67267 RepID=UPI0013866B94|nr:histidine kinase [Streptomyces alboflavus]